MKRILTSLCLIGLFANPAFSQEGVPGHPSNPSSFSQVDSGFWNNVIVKLNPTLMLDGCLIEGEFGAIVQFPIERTPGQNGIFKNMDAFIGGGYNTSFDTYTTVRNPNGTGYTIRGGLYGYFKDKYLSLQFFYRRWDIRGIYDADYTPDGSQDNIINPFAIVNDDVNSPIQYLENATVNVYSIDVVYGKQYISGNKTCRVFFEWYIGTGLRFKTIRLEELGYYDPNTFIGPGKPGTYYPLSTPEYIPQTSIYPDLKVGFMIGFGL